MPENKAQSSKTKMQPGKPQIGPSHGRPGASAEQGGNGQDADTKSSGRGRKPVGLPGARPVGGQPPKRGAPAAPQMIPEHSAPKAAGHVVPGGGRVTKLTSTRGENVDSLRDKVGRLELTIEISKSFAATLDLNKLVKNIFEKVVDVLHCEAGSMWLVTKDKKKIVCEVAQGGAGDKIVGLEVEVGKGIVGSVVETREPDVVLDAQSDQRLAHLNAGDFKTRGMICVPLLVGKECLGAFQVLNKQQSKGNFDAEDLELLQNLSSAAAISIRNARLFASEKKVQELQALFKISEEITSTLDLTSVLMTVVNLAGQVIEYDRAVIALYDDSDKLELHAISGATTIDREDPNVKITEDLLHWVGENKAIYIDTKENHLGKDNTPQSFEKYFKQNEEIRSLYAKPLKDEEGRLGVMMMESKEEDFVDPSKADIISILTNQVTVAIRNAKLYSSVPKAGLLGSFAGADKAKNWKRRFAYAAALAAFLVISVFIPVGKNVDGNVTVMQDPEFRQVAFAPFGGIVQEFYPGVAEGSFVKAGDPMFRLDTSGLELDRMRALSALSKLNDSRTLANSGLDSAQGAAIAAQEETVRGLDAQIDAAIYRAAIDGYIISYVDESGTNHPVANLLGKEVRKGEAMFEIVNFERVEVEMKVFQDSIFFVDNHYGVEGEGASDRQLGPDDLEAALTFSVAGLPSKSYTAAFERAGRTPLEDPERGTYYLVHCSVGSTTDESGFALRSGMQGTGSLNCGTQSLFQLLFSPVINNVLGWFK
ncbi:MAG: GAF domain-containing protein [Planctomycetes bacterium]|nr:GAF domain-containing protein [Planctomycetota bacterium]